MQTDTNSDYIIVNLPEGTKLTKAPMTMLQRRRLLCEDLEYCVTQDKDLLVSIIDEFVYALDDKQVKEYEAEVNKILGEE